MRGGGAAEWRVCHSANSTASVSDRQRTRRRTARSRTRSPRRAASAASARASAPAALTAGPSPRGCALTGQRSRDVRRASRRPSRWRHALDLQRVQPAAVGAQTRKRKPPMRRRFAALRQPAERLQHEAADGVEFVVGEVGAEMRVEVGDLGLRLDAEAAVGLGDDVVLALVEVVLVLDVADDLLQHVLDRDEARHAAVFVDDDRDVVAVGAELAQQHVEPLRLRHEHRGPQRVAEIEARPDSRSSSAAPSRAGCRRRRPCSRRSPESASAWSRGRAAGTPAGRRRSTRSPSARAGS